LKENQTQEKYSFLWLKSYKQQPLGTCHFHHMQNVIPDKIVRGSIGIDIGCGCGQDLFRMAKDNPCVHIIGMDISDGVYAASRLCVDLTNVSVIRGSAEDIPLKNEVCDFVYSFGVLHHLTDYKKGFLEVVRVLKRHNPCFLYLYEDHCDNSIKYIAVKIISFIRKITVMIPSRLLYFLCSLASPFVVILFSYPASLFRKFKVTHVLYERMPFNFANGPFSLTADLYDRFATPIEHRFGRKELLNIFTKSGFYNINITKLKDTAGWVAWGYKR